MAGAVARDGGEGRCVARVATVRGGAWRAPPTAAAAACTARRANGAAGRRRPRRPCGRAPRPSARRARCAAAGSQPAERAAARR
eukprot:391290-Prymnesium_polylepis.1